MYYIILIFILYGCIKELVLNKRDILLFKVIYIFLFFLSIFRYGQGQDYFNYNDVYLQIESFTAHGLVGIFLFSDFGYAFLNYLAIIGGIPYIVFMAIITGIMMAMFYSFLKKQCNCSLYSLAVFYFVIYMIYSLSITRQGLCLAFFLCYMYPLLKERKFKRYYSLMFIAATIHLSVLVVGLFPLLLRLNLNNVQLLILYFLSVTLLLFNMNILSFIHIGFVQERIIPYLTESSSNQILAKCVRIILTFPLFFLGKYFMKNTEIKNCRNFFIFGFFVYSLLSFSELTSSRIWGYFLGFECIILSNISFSEKNISRIFIVYYLFISIILWFKDINATIDQGKYQNCTMFSYPYISLFEGENTLNYYRTHKGFIDE